jgi:hypothetical protein
VGHRRAAANGIAAVAELSQKIAGPPDIFFEIAALAPATAHGLAGCPMKETDVICPTCSAGYQRIQLESRQGRPGEYHCLICDHVLEVFDGTVEVAHRLTVQPVATHGHAARFRASGARQRHHQVE